ncbi:MAG: DUF1573 domain-containing protein [Bacteroidaceae bacterium]|nr:DUF1573 domain-containing protein [Bacteroidaceae bacterium]
MKRLSLMFLLLVSFVSLCSAQTVESVKKQAEIKFDETTYDFGRFPESSPVQTCKFTFTNTGNDLLLIHQAVASCGCTVPKYSKEPIKPGEKGSITVTYNGKGKIPGVFKKSITLRTNAKTEMIRLYIRGEMERE